MLCPCLIQPTGSLAFRHQNILCVNSIIFITDLIKLFLKLPKQFDIAVIPGNFKNQLLGQYLAFNLLKLLMICALQDFEKTTPTQKCRALQLNFKSFFSSKPR